MGEVDEVAAFVSGCEGSWHLDLPDAGEGMCCVGAGVYGPQRCTCWRPVYDLEQQPLDEEMARWLDAGIEPVTRTLMCGDCAYRPGSPERNGDPMFRGDAETLEGLAARGERFWCHQGMRRVLRWRHPSGAEVAGSPADYDPPIRHGVPWRADGTPGELCAGCAARHRALNPQPAVPGGSTGG